MVFKNISAEFLEDTVILVSIVAYTNCYAKYKHEMCKDKHLQLKYKIRSVKNYFYSNTISKIKNSRNMQLLIAKLLFVLIKVLYHINIH